MKRVIKNYMTPEKGFWNSVQGREIKELILMGLEKNRKKLRIGDYTPTLKDFRPFMKKVLELFIDTKKLVQVLSAPELGGPSLRLKVSEIVPGQILDEQITLKGSAVTRGKLLFDIKYWQDVLDHHRHVFLNVLEKAINAYWQHRTQKSPTPDHFSTRFPTPSGTKWEEVTITFISNESIRIKAREVSKKFHFSEIGFGDRRSADKPNMIWKYFHALAQLSGELAWDDPLDLGGRPVDIDRDVAQKRISVLRKTLQTIVGIKDDPIYTYRKKGLYKTRFSLRDETTQY